MQLHVFVTSCVRDHHHTRMLLEQMFCYTSMLRNRYLCISPVSSSEHPEPHQPKLLLGAGAECELPGPLHEDGDRDSTGGQSHHHPAAQRETGETEPARSGRQ